jgi:hypothetical protein
MLQPSQTRWGWFVSIPSRDNSDPDGPGPAEDNAAHRKVRARVEHVFYRMNVNQALRRTRSGESATADHARKGVGDRGGHRVVALSFAPLTRLAKKSCFSGSGVWSFSVIRQ